MIVHDVDQNGEAWHRLRLGIPTASEFHRILTPKGKLSSQAEGYMWRLLAEWITGAPLENFETQYMQRGHDLEDEAVKDYEFQTGRSTYKVGFIMTDDGLIGCSPDRLVGDDGDLEIKVSSPHIHVGYMLTGKIAEDHYPQVQGRLLIEQREWVDVQSYCRGFPSVVIRVYPEVEYQDKMDAALREFVERMLAARELITQKYGDFRPPAPPPMEHGFDVTDEDVEAMLRKEG